MSKRKLATMKTIVDGINRPHIVGQLEEARNEFLLQLDIGRLLAENEQGSSEYITYIKEEWDKILREPYSLRKCVVRLLKPVYRKDVGDYMIAHLHWGVEPFPCDGYDADDIASNIPFHNGEYEIVHPTKLKLTYEEIMSEEYD